LFTGDGGFMMASHDLDAVRLAGIKNLNIVVLNDERYGSEEKYLRPLALPFDTITQTLPDVVALARVYGGDGVVVRTMDELEALALPRTGLFIVDVRLDPELDGEQALPRKRQSITAQFGE